MKLVTSKTSGFCELDNAECLKIVGGVHWAVAGAAGAAILNIFNHWDHFKQGLSGQAERPEE